MLRHGKEIAEKIESLIEKKRVSRSVLGEALGVRKTVSRSWKSTKLNNFLAQLRKNIVDRDQVASIASYFEKPLEYFLLEDEDRSTGGNVNYGNGEVVQTRGSRNRVTVGEKGNSIYEQMVKMNHDELQDHVINLRKFNGAGCQA